MKHPGERWVLVIGVFLAIGLLWMVFADRGESAGSDSTIAHGTNSDPDHLAPLAADVLADPKRETDATLTAQETSVDEGTLKIRLIRQDTGEVIPNHEFWFMPTTQWGLTAAQNREKHGVRIKTGPDGIATIDDPNRRMNFYAEKDHLVGSLKVDLRGRDKTKAQKADLVLIPSGTLFIRVIDPSGNPVQGVPVSHEFTSPKETRRGGFGTLASKSLSDGTLPWRDYALVLHEAKQEGRVVHGLRLRAEIPGDTGVIAEFSPLPTDGSSVDLRLPPTGTVTLHLKDTEGRPVPGNRGVQLSTLLPLDGAGGQKTEGPQSTRFLQGTAFFPAVALGKSFRASVWSVPRPRLAIDLQGPGPDDLHIEQTLVINPDVIGWRGRVLDASGQPLEDRFLLGHLQTKKSWYFDESGTDPDGSFLFLFDAKAREAELVEASVGASRRELVDVSSMGPFQTGIHDLGHLVLDKSVKLLSGTIHRDPTAACKDIVLTVQKRASDADKWRTHLVEFTEEPDGTFTIYGQLSNEQYRLHFGNHYGCYLAPLPTAFTPGQEDWEIHFEKGHDLTSRFLIDGEPSNWSQVPVDVVLRPIGGPAVDRVEFDSANWAYLHKAGERGSDPMLRHWRGLPAGTFELTVTMKGGGEVLFKRSNIRLPGDEDVIDLDLREQFREYRLRLIPPAGMDMEQGAVAYLIRGDTHTTSYGRWDEEADAIAVLAPPGYYDVWILAKGYQPILIHSLNSDQDLALTPSNFPLSLRLSTPVMLPQGVALQLRLTSSEKLPSAWSIPALQDFVIPEKPMHVMSPSGTLSRHWRRTTRTMLDNRGEGTMVANRPGLQTIHLELISTSMETRIDWPTEPVIVEGFSPSTITLPSTGEAQSLRLKIPQSAIDTALQNAGIR